MRNPLPLLALTTTTLLLGACAQTRHHHYAPNEGGPRSSRNVVPAVAPADAVGFRVVRPSTDYPLNTCVVSGAALRPTLGSIPPIMDGPMALIYDGTEIQICCSACIAQFRRDPEKYVLKVRAART